MRSLRCRNGSERHYFPRRRALLKGALGGGGGGGGEGGVGGETEYSAFLFSTLIQYLTG